MTAAPIEGIELPTERRTAWRRALPALLIVLLTILVLYRDTARAMVEIWWRSETFTHGFLVLPISLWLIWRLRRELVLLSPRPSLWTGLALLLTGFFWLLGELATVGVLSQFALTTLLVLCVPAVLGWAVTRRVIFPLAFLYFAVPFGEFAMPKLMEWTADVTVLGIRLSGIPVYREGLQFVIPSGNWSVVEACSGVRYLIASLTVGTLFAYLNYYSLKRRLLFVGVAIIVPVFANWMRAYLIVMLGHLSGNKLAAGVDHLIYGWLFFGAVIMLMFWIGSFWREDEPPQPLPPLTTPGTPASRERALWQASILVLVVSALWPLALWRIEHRVAPPVEHIEPLAAVSGWQNDSAEPARWTPSYDKPSASLNTAFSSDGKTVGLYIGYYRNQDYQHKLVSSTNVLVRSNDPVWAQVSSAVRALSVDKREFTIRSAELKAGESVRMRVWQWYWVNGRWTANDYLAKAYTALAKMSGRGDDSAVIVLYAPKEQAGGGDAVLASFVASALPVIEQALERTRDRP